MSRLQKAYSDQMIRDAEMHARQAMYHLNSLDDVLRRVAKAQGLKPTSRGRWDGIIKTSINESWTEAMVVDLHERQYVEAPKPPSPSYVALD